nr:phospholipid-transporting ATPase ABCA3-like [Cherax quadricarinatus]
MSQNSSGKPSMRRKRSVWRHLVLLLWKNLVLRQRHWLLTFFELFLPTALFSVILFIRLIPNSDFVPEYINTTTVFRSHNEMKLREYVCENYGIWLQGYCYVPENQRGNLQLYYGPSGDSGGFPEKVAKHVASNLHIPSWALTPVVNNEEMDSLVEQSYYTANSSVPAFFVGLYFHDLTEPVKAPTNLKYDLRVTGSWMTSYRYPFLQSAGPANSSNKYINHGFTLIQSIVDRFYISEVTGNDAYLNYKVEVEKYPYPEYYDDFGASQLYGTFLPNYVVLSFVLLSPALIKSVVHEKETGVRELMRLMGMNRWLLWLGWFFHALVVVLVMVTIITVMITVGLQSRGAYVPPILNYSDSFFVWILLVLYGISSITFCLAISTLFSRPTLATTMGILIWLFSYYIPNTFVFFKYDNLGLAPKILACFIPNMAMTLAFRVMQMFEGRALGIHWNHLWDTGNPRDELTPAMILLMLILDSFIYCVLIWYIDQVSPGKYGVALPWYFPFQVSSQLLLLSQLHETGVVWHELIIQIRTSWSKLRIVQPKSNCSKRTKIPEQRDQNKDTRSKRPEQRHQIKETRTKRPEQRDQYKYTSIVKYRSTFRLMQLNRCVIKLSAVKS